MRRHSVWFHLYKILEKAKPQGQKADHQGEEWEGGMDCKGIWKNLEDDGNILYLNCGGGYMTM